MQSGDRMRRLVAAGWRRAAPRRRNAVKTWTTAIRMRCLLARRSNEPTTASLEPFAKHKAVCQPTGVPLLWTIVVRWTNTSHDNQTNAHRLTYSPHWLSKLDFSFNYSPRFPSLQSFSEMTTRKRKYDQVNETGKYAPSQMVSCRCRRLERELKGLTWWNKAKHHSNCWLFFPLVIFADIHSLIVLTMYGIWTNELNLVWTPTTAIRKHQ